jgi:hypothetical protein
MITREELLIYLRYEPSTGLFTWRAHPQRSRVGQLAGTTNKQGYVIITINKKLYKAHRLAFLFMTGEFPNSNLQVDHIDGVCDNNRWCNLRIATAAQNQHNSKIAINNSTGVKGVSFNKRTNKYAVDVRLNKQHNYLGEYATLDEASKVAKSARLQLHGNFAKYG